MSDLSAGQLDTLRDLSRKDAGFAIGWVSIACARELTDLGLAVRTRSGWEISEEGRALLLRLGPADGDGSSDVVTPGFSGGRPQR